jgi:hypothetical protein
MNSLRDRRARPILLTFCFVAAHFRAPATTKRLPRAVADGQGGVIIAAADVAGTPERGIGASIARELAAAGMD